MMDEQTNTTHSRPPKLPGMDFANLPVIELASTLRKIGQSLLHSSLHEGYPPDWSILLPLEQARILVQPRAFAQASRRKRVASKKPDPQYKEAVTQAIDGKLSLRDWRARILGRLTLHFGGPPSTYLPDYLWSVIGETAWRDLDFQYWVAAQVRAYFRARVLFGPSVMPSIRLSPRTLWGLIALSGAGMSRLSRPFNLDQRTIPRAVRRLQDAGQRQFLEAAGWTSFWDRWIISESLQRWPVALESLDAELRDALLALPLLSLTPPEILAQRDKRRNNKMKTRQLAAPN